MHQIPCRDLIQAHCLRSWLLSHEIEAEVWHENTSGLYLAGTFPPHVAIADEDVARYEQISHENDPPLNDTFIPPETEEMEKEVPAGRTPPTLLGTIVFGAALGGAMGLLAPILAFLFAAFSHQSVLSDRPLPPELQAVGEIPLWCAGFGAVSGVFFYLILRLVGSLREQDGSPSLLTRWLGFIFLFLATDLLFLIFAPISIIRHFWDHFHALVK